MGRLFGTDGVRGRFGNELTLELAQALGRAAAMVLGDGGSHVPSFVVGWDTRASSPAIRDALVEGISRAGGDTILAGQVPTPAVAFLTPAVGATSGVVISASHNPPEDNGIKFFGRDGVKLPDADEDRIEAEIADGRSRAEAPGHVRDLPDSAPGYLDHVVAAAEVRLEGLHVVVDCANGAATGFAPEVLRRLGARVTAIHAEPDGSNINVDCGATRPRVVADAVLSAGADAGVAYDGDADRALFAGAAGEVIDGDQVLAACAIALKESGHLVGNTVITTVMANLGFHRSMAEHGIEVVATDVGDRYVYEAMRARGAVIGGEQSGHIIFSEHATTGDGLLTTVRFLSLARRRGLTVSELAGVMRRFPQVMRNVPVAHKELLDGAADVWDAVAASEAELREEGRVLVRASGTEPVVRIMVEAPSEEAAAGHASRIEAAVRETLG